MDHSHYRRGIVGCGGLSRSRTPWVHPPSGLAAARLAPLLYDQPAVLLGAQVERPHGGEVSAVPPLYACRCPAGSPSSAFSARLRRYIISLSSLPACSMFALMLARSAVLKGKCAISSQSILILSRSVLISLFSFSTLLFTYYLLIGREPQSSSASRFTAGPFGFLLLIQSGDRPER